MIRVPSITGRLVIHPRTDTRQPQIPNNPNPNQSNLINKVGGFSIVAVSMDEICIKLVLQTLPFRMARVTLRCS